MARRSVSAIRRAFPSRMAARTGIRFRCRSRVYDETIRVMKSAVEKARLGRDEELAAIRRLDDQARALERHASGPSVDELIAEELHNSHSYQRPQRVRLGAAAGRGRCKRW